MVSMKVRSFSKRIVFTSVLLQEEHLQKNPDDLFSITFSSSLTDTQMQWKNSLQVSQTSFSDASFEAIQVVAEHGAIDMFGCFRYLCLYKKIQKNLTTIFFSV